MLTSLAKYRKRALTAGLNTLRFLLVSLSQFILAKIVTDEKDLGIWGEVVHILIYVQMAAMVIAWGNREYTLREMGRAPANARGIWASALTSRFPLLLLACILLIFLLPPGAGLPALIWTASLFVLHSFESIILFKERVRLFGYIEIAISSLFIATAWFFKSSWITSINVLWLLALVNVVRALVHLVVFNSFWSRAQYRISAHYLKSAIPFLLLALSGALFSKIDLYVADHFLTSDDLGKYQLFISSFILMQAISRFLLMPWEKHLYRFESKQILSFCLKYALFGIPIVLLATISIYWLLENLYALHISPDIYTLGGLFAWTMFISLPLIHYFYGQKRERNVLYVNVSGLTLNFILSIFLVSRMGFKGLILASTLSQVLVSAIYLQLIINGKRTPQHTL